MQRKTLVAACAALSATLSHASAYAWEARLVGTAGLGRSSLTRPLVQPPDFNGQLVTLSEEPLQLALAGEVVATERLVLGLEYRRAIRLAPFSSGVTLIGTTGRWFFMEPSPPLVEAPPRADAPGSTITYHALAPYFGLATGYASANITREKTLISKLDGSGAFVGGMLGAEYPVSGHLGLRAELLYWTVPFGQVQIDTVSLGLSVLWGIP